MIPTFALDDGTTLTPDKLSWEAATLAGEDAASIREWLGATVTKHWDARTVPTKLGISTWDEEGEDYKNHAELAAAVFYQEFRAAIMGLVLAKETRGKSHVIALGNEGAVKYSDKPAHPVQIDDVLKTAELDERDGGAKRARPRRRSRPSPWTT